MDEDEPSVTELVVASIAGDESAWNALIRRYAPLVMSVISRYRLGEADAQDVAQVLWLRLVEHLGELREPRALPMWIIVTTRNECVRLLRAAHRVEPCDPAGPVFEEQVDAAEPDQELLRAEVGEALMQALAELPDRYRELLLLLVEDPPVPYTEIARRLGVPLGSIGPTRGRAIDRLRQSPAVVALFEERRDPAGTGGGHHDLAAMAGR